MKDFGSGGTHLATVAFEGELWHAYLEAVDNPHRPDVFQGRLRFDAGNADPEASRATAVIIVEDSYDTAVQTAREFDERTLVAMLRSAAAIG
ncbi:MAG: hypothetical protein J4G12_05685 [Gemmatimonadetes bacterium]|nr:hypothetical protein [Gemmatimonadota bacterium]